MLHRTPSESLLASLHLDFSQLHLPARNPPSPSSAFLTDEELSDVDLPPLGQSVVEEQEERFAHQASKALSFLATPPAATCGAEDGAVFSPYASRTPVPDAEGDLNPYFAHHRTLHHGGTAGWTPSSVGSSSASSSADDSGYSSPATSTSSCSPSPSFKPVDTSLAARRGRPMNISLPPIPSHAHLNAAVRPPTPKQVTGFNFNSLSAQEGVLKNNFAGVQLRRSPLVQEEAMDAPSAMEEALPLRRKRRDHGFAF